MIEKLPKKGEFLSIEQASLSTNEVLEIAEQWAKDTNILWRDPVEANYCYDDSPYWLVRSNALGKGGSVIKVDDEQRKVVEHHLLAR